MDTDNTGKAHEDKEEAPEVHEDYVQEELDQENITHVGDWRRGATQMTGNRDGDRHLGATEDEVVPIVPPMAGPADLIGEQNENAQGNETGFTEIGEEMVDPRDELTPG